jgi:hypothetical protein
MRFVFGLLACAAMNLAVADDPPAPAASAPAAVAAPPANATPPAAAAVASAAQPAAATQTASVAAATAQADFQEKHFVSEGYSVEMHHGEKMFCRREDELGSRLGAKKYCSTAEQLTAIEKDAQRAMDRSTWQQNNPSGK